MGAVLFMVYRIKPRFLLIVLQSIIMVVCMLAALQLENPSPKRLAVLALLMTALVIWVNLGEIITDSLCKLLKSKTHCPAGYGRLRMIIFLVDVALLYMLEQNSRFILNYYLHLLYFVLMVNAGVRLSRRQGLLVNAITFIAFLSKFTSLLSTSYSPFNLSLAMFSFFTGILTLLIISYAKSMAEEKENTDRLYAELKSYAGKVKELSIAGERSRIAGELHDIIGHSLTALIMELEICSRIMAEDSQKALQMVKKSAVRARGALANVRRAVDALKPEELEGKRLEAALAGLVQEFSLSCGVLVDIEISQCPALSPRAEMAVFRAVQEALTNSLRHGKAGAVKIQASRGAGGIVINIADDGCGAERIVPGHGLSGMRERLESAGGRLSFYSGGENKGFFIEISLPVMP
jgi:signal transduction histidine kinase